MDKGNILKIKMKNHNNGFEKLSTGKNKNDITIQLWGWIIFILSSIFFIASSVKNGDILGLCGGVLFFIACLVFLIPFFRHKH